jgi:hypothetical protein
MRVVKLEFGVAQLVSSREDLDASGDVLTAGSRELDARNPQDKMSQDSWAGPP